MKSTIEILEDAISYTSRAYIDSYTSQSGNEISNNEKESLMYDSIHYSAKVLSGVVQGMQVYNCYTRLNNLRTELMSLTPVSIKNELLKNAVNYSAFLKKTCAPSDVLDITQAHSADEVASILVNRMKLIGIDDAYQLLDNPNILEAVCTVFVDGRITRKTELDEISKTDPEVINFNNDLDSYCDSANLRTRKR